MQVLYNPIIKRLGYEYSSDDSPSVTELRTRAITQAAQAGDAECVYYNLYIFIYTDCLASSVLKELKGRFDHYMKTGDDSKIPADLIRITFASVRHF